MRFISFVTSRRSIHPFFVCVFFLGAAAVCLLGPKDDHVDVESVIQDSRRLIEQSERLQEAVSRSDWQVVAKLSEQIKQEQETRQRLQAERDAWITHAKQIALIIFAICFVLIASSYFIEGFRAQSKGTTPKWPL
jgi:hypothetical protein